MSGGYSSMKVPIDIWSNRNQCLSFQKISKMGPHQTEVKMNIACKEFQSGPRGNNRQNSDQSTGTSYYMCTHQGAAWVLWPYEKELMEAAQTDWWRCQPGPLGDQVAIVCYIVFGNGREAPPDLVSKTVVGPLKSKGMTTSLEHLLSKLQWNA